MENGLTAKLQQRELAVLCEIDRLFTENNIEYFLAYGTVLGCVRHGGFIPWDDDVDLFVRGEDYPRIKKLFAESDTGFLELHDFETKEGYPYVFPKIVDKRTKLREARYAHLPYMGGVYIDLFPLFSVSDNGVARTFSEKLRYFRYARLRLYYEDISASGGARKLVATLVKKLSDPKRIQKKLYRRYIKGNKGGKKMAEPNVFASDALIDSELFRKSTKLDFEGVKLPVPERYEDYLRASYGDYMQLPPEDKRSSPHTFAYVDLVDLKEEGK